MAIRRRWDIQWAENWWISLGFHVDHTDPSLTLHLPGLIVCLGRCKQPGFRWSIRRLFRENPDRGRVAMSKQSDAPECPVCDGHGSRTGSAYGGCGDMAYYRCFKCNSSWTLPIGKETGGANHAAH